MSYPLVISERSTTSITCSACRGKGSFLTRFYSAEVLTNCKCCKGHGSITICTSCGSKVSYGRHGAVCGCNSVSLRVAA